MEVELTHGTAKAIIDPRGAYLTNLSDDSGDIFFPKRNLTAADGSVKIRGGCHVCLPNFGPGGSSSQPQHGFGRISDWEVTDKTENGIILTLVEGPEEYKDMSTVLTYQLADSMIMMTCEVTNNGQESLRVTPAFHPYFSLAGEKEVEIGDVKELLDDLADTKFVNGTAQTLVTSSRTFEMTSDNLPVWAEWTDQLGKYVCVEPTQNGYAFLNDQPAEDEMLPAGSSKTYKVSITWG